MLRTMPRPERVVLVVWGLLRQTLEVLEMGIGEDYNDYEADPLDPEYMADLKRFRGFRRLRDLTLGSYHFGSCLRV